MQPIAGLLVHRVEDFVRGVQADQVDQRERPHGQATPERHRDVDVLPGGVVRFVHGGGVVEIAEQQRIRDEPGPVSDGDVDFAELLRECLDVVDDVLLGDDAADDLDQLHHGRRIEEVQSDDLARSVGRDGDLGDGQ